MQTHDILDLRDRVVMDYADAKRAVEKALGEVRDLRADGFIRRILGKGDLESIRNWEAVLDKRLDEPFSVVVMGDFKRGKSSLVNALLGRKIATVNVTPETMTINRISHGEEAKCEAVLKNGMRLKLAARELDRAALEKVVAQLPAPVDYIDIRDDNPVLREISIVDTPGVGDVLKEFDRTVEDFIIQADAIIYVVSALSPLSESEQLFLSAALRPHGFSRLFMVVNMSDCLDNAGDVERIKNLVYDRTRAFSDSAMVFALSALDEFCRKTGVKRPNPEMGDYLAEAFTTFRDALENDVILQKDVIKAERLLEIAAAMLKDIRGRLRLIGAMLRVKKDDLEAMEQKCREDLANIGVALEKSNRRIAAVADKLYVDAYAWMEAFLGRLKRELERLKTDADTVTLQKYLQFYMMDMVKQAILLCLREHRSQMEEELGAAATEYAEESLGGVRIERFAEIAVQLRDISWTGADTAAFAVEMGRKILFEDDANGLGALLGLGSMVVGGLARERQMKGRKSDLITPLLENYGKLSESVYGQLRSAYTEYGRVSAQKLEEAFRGQLNASLGALEQTREILKTEDIREEELKEQLAVAMESLDRMDGLLAAAGRPPADDPPPRPEN